MGNEKLMDFPMGLQIHCLRHSCANDFEATLDAVVDLGVSSIEMCYFPGCAGNPWGDFGYVASYSGEHIAESIRNRSLAISGCHFPASSLVEDSLDESIRWARAIDIDTMVVPAVQPDDAADLESWRAEADKLNKLGKVLSSEGMHLVYHTQTDIWRELEGATILSHFLDWLDPKYLSLELDISGAVHYGADWLAILHESQLDCHAVHLRDANYSGQVVPYLPSLPLGEGDVDWRAALSGMKASGVGLYILEMEMMDPDQVMPSLRQSLNYLREL